MLHKCMMHEFVVGNGHNMRRPKLGALVFPELKKIISWFYVSNSEVKINEKIF